MSKHNSYFFHDYETYGLNTKKTRVAQFVGIRTDLDLNIIETEQFEYFSIPSIDFLPSPEASLVTGLTPQSILENQRENNLNDLELFKKIHQHFNTPGTCSVGYNSLRFDDEITRNGFYRNLLPIYTREFQSNCSRFDVLNMIREFAFLYPDLIKIPVDEEGNKIFKLDTLAPLNGFNDGQYHDAFTDVKATIFMSKLMKDQKPEFWEHRIELHQKQNMIDYILNSRDQIVLYTDSTNGGKNDFVEPILITTFCYPDKNSYIGIKLSDINGIKEILNTDESKLKERLYMTNVELEEEELLRLPMVKIAANKLPTLTKLSDLDSLGVSSINKDLNMINKNLNFLLENQEQFRKKTMLAFKKEEYNNTEKNPDLMIYNGFMDRADENMAKRFQISLEKKDFKDYIKNNLFVSDKVNQLARKIIYRNFAEDLLKDEELKPYLLDFIKKSYAMLATNGFDPSFSYNESELSNENFLKNDKMVEFTLPEFRETLPELEEKYKDDVDKLKILNDFKKSLNLTLDKFKNYKKLMSEQTQSNENKKTPKMR